MSAPLPAHRARDTSVLKLMGWFFLLFAGLVLLGLFWTPDFEGRVVNAVASSLLIGVGVVFLYTGKRLGRRA